MAPIKFEDKLKDKLENRSLEPTADAWKTLSNRLDKEDKKKSTIKFWWLGIAAGILGIIFFTTQFYKTPESFNELPTVVNAKTEAPKDSKTISEPLNSKDALISSDENEERVDIATTETNSEYMNVSNTALKESKKKAITGQPKDTQNLIASNENSNIVTKDTIRIKTLSQEELKVIEVVDVIKQLQAGETLVTDKEIDSLLNQAQREILKQRLFDETTRTVNADALLQDVEVELEQSFRDKVFEALKSSYNSVKTAVAERRN
ncbi:MAG: hypothetical protein KDD05_04425 [Psychroserpens sp.]|nr:hypothetical protein [Psychroserpens sp.]